MKTIQITTKGFILFSTLCLLIVSIMGLLNPQSLMDMVNVNLTNTDAYSSIRGVYGGVGITLVALLLYLLKKDKLSALYFLTLLWGSYALSRVITNFNEGPLGPFGKQWLLIESLLFCIGLSLSIAFKRKVTPYEKNVY